MKIRHGLISFHYIVCSVRSKDYDMDTRATAQPLFAQYFSIAPYGWLCIDEVTKYRFCWNCYLMRNRIYLLIKRIRFSYNLIRNGPIKNSIPSTYIILEGLVSHQNVNANFGFILPLIQGRAQHPQSRLRWGLHLLRTHIGRTISDVTAFRCLELRSLFPWRRHRRSGVPTERHRLKPNWKSTSGPEQGDTTAQFENPRSRTRWIAHIIVLATGRRSAHRRTVEGTQSTPYGCDWFGWPVC